MTAARRPTKKEKRDGEQMGACAKAWRNCTVPSSEVSVGVARSARRSCATMCTTLRRSPGCEALVGGHGGASARASQQKAAMRSEWDMAPQCDGVTMGAASSQHARRHDARSRTPWAENQASQVARVALAGLSFGTTGAGRGAACCQRRAEVFFGMRSAERRCPAGMVSEARCAS